MWLFLRRRLLFWFALTVLAPLVAKVLQAAGNTLEARRGSSALSRALRKGGDAIDSYRAGRRKR